MVIGISGKIGSGKDTIGKMVKDRLPNYQIRKFADKLKDIVCMVTGCTREQLEDQEFKDSLLGPEWNYLKPIESWSGNMEVAMTYRELLQKIGTEGMRVGVHKNFWVNATMSGFRESSNWVITDVRFNNEVEAIKEKGGLLIRVVRGDGDTGNHPSEIALDNYAGFDYRIENNSSLEHLSIVVKEILTIEGLLKW